MHEKANAEASVGTRLKLPYLAILGTLWITVNRQTRNKARKQEEKAFE